MNLSFRDPFQLDRTMVGEEGRESLDAFCLSSGGGSGSGFFF